MNYKISLSVVVPLFNKNYSIERALRSISRQTRLADEIIVVNDGSTDNVHLTLERIRADITFSLYNQENKGVSSARNLGVSASKSSYVCFLDADDEWYPNHLEDIERIIAAYEMDLMLVTLKNKRVGKDYSTEKTYGICDEKNEAFRLLQRRSDIISSSSVCIKRRDFLEIGGFPDGCGRGEDLYLWYRIINEQKFALADIPGAIIHNDCRQRVSRSRLREVPIHIEYFSFAASQNPSSIPKDLRKLLLLSSIKGSIFLSMYAEPHIAFRYCLSGRRFGYAGFVIPLLMSVVPYTVKASVLPMAKKFVQSFCRLTQTLGFLRGSRKLY